MHPFAHLRARLADAVLRGPGALDAATREAAASGRELPAPLAAYAAKVRLHAYRVTDEDVAALKAAGYTEDQVFEATVSAALGAATERLEAGLAALAQAEGGAADAARAG